MNKEITITTKQIKQSIDDLVDERDELQDKVYKLQDKVTQLETNRDEAYKLLDDIDEYMLVEQHLKLVEAKKLLERGKE